MKIFPWPCGLPEIVAPFVLLQSRRLSPNGAPVLMCGRDRALEFKVFDNALADREFARAVMKSNHVDATLLRVGRAGVERQSEVARDDRCSENDHPALISKFMTIVEIAGPHVRRRARLQYRP